LRVVDFEVQGSRAVVPSIFGVEFEEEFEFY
jgi:hypothetical protein